MDQIVCLDQGGECVLQDPVASGWVVAESLGTLPPGQVWGVGDGPDEGVRCS